MKAEERIKKLEQEVAELRKQLLDLALRQPAVVVHPATPAPTPYIQPQVPCIPYTPGWPVVTCGSAGVAPLVMGSATSFRERVLTQ